MAEANAAVSEETSLQENTEGCEDAVMQQDDDGKSKKQLPVDMYYEYEELYSRPFVTRDSEISENLLHFSHSFCYDSGRRSNLQVLDDKTLIFVAGNLLVLLDISTKKQRYLRSCSGGGIGSIAVHPSRDYFAAAEKGNHPNIIVYEYPSLRPYRILRGGTERAYSFAEFKQDGSLLASVGNAPDYMLTLWDWRQEKVMLSCKAVSQEVYRVCFSSYNPELLTTSGSGHIKFWKIDSTFTGVKLQGCMGNFGLTTATDIEGFMELPSGKVVSGTDWGNLLLWDRSDIKLEICKKNGQTCHVGTVQPFALEDGQLLTFGSDGVIRVWDYELISGADSGRFEMEPVNEMVIGRNICISSMVKSSLSDSFVWFAQDSNGTIWKLDLSFSNKALDPVCLFSFHHGPIQSLDVSKTSYLMATIALDYSVKIFDFLEKRELKTVSFKKNATTLSWAPLSVDQSGCLLLIGFEDGVVRVFELFNPQRLLVLSEYSPKDDAGLRLKQAFKPHNAAVTSVAYERNGAILATGSVDCTVFFFTVEEKYNPIGFVHVPGAVQGLEWSPQSHPDNKLLILCQNGYVIEVQRPDLKAREPPKTFHLSELPRRSFKFMSIKSRIKREEENAKRQAIKEEKKKEKEERLKESQQTLAEQEEEEEEEEEEDLSPLYIPDSPSPLYCGFYSRPGQFWLSMGGFDSGFLYHCKFSAEQDEDPEMRQDVPFDFLPVQNADDDPVRAVTFSSDRQLMLCGMHSGSIRVYPLQPGDHNITTMQAYWTLSVHDNEYGHLRHIRCSHDDHFVLTAGDDGNIFSFSLFPPEELQKSLARKKAKVPSPREGLENEPLPLDIEDPTAYSIESAKQNLQKNRLRQEAELKLQEKHKKLAGLQKKFEQVLKVNQSLPEHVRLKPEELQLDPRFYEHVEKMKAERVMEVRKQLAWEQERWSIAFNKLQDWFKGSPEANMVTVVAIRTDHSVSTYHLPVLASPSAQQITPSTPDGDREHAAPEHSKHKTKPATDSSEAEEEKKLHPRDDRKRVKLGDKQEGLLQRAAKKAELARAKIEKRKQEWAQLYAEKPDKNYEDPRDVEAIREAKENLKLKSDVVANLKVIAERKREELAALQENFREKQIEMNRRIVALRDSKVRLVSWLHTQVQQLQKLQLHLANHLHCPPPTLPSILPEETPEKWLQYKLTALERYRVLREQSCKDRESVCLSSSEVESLLEQMKKEMKREEEKEEQERTSSPCASSVTTEEETVMGEVAELSELEVELQREEEIRLLYEQESLLKKMESSMSQFDMELLLLRQQKVRLDFQLKLADLHQLTLFQEMLLLKQFEKREGILQEKLNRCIKEENNISSALEESKEQLELKQSQIVKLQEKEKALHADFQDLLIENEELQKFLTRVFKKNIKPVKEKKEEEEDSDEDDDWDDDDDEDDDDDDDDSTEDGGAAMDINVCPPGCNPEVFDYTLNLRECRQNLAESLVEERKNVQTLKIQCDALVKKETAAKNCRKAAEKELEQVNREIQEEINTLDVVVPLRLKQIQFATSDLVPSDLSEALVLDCKQMNKLQERIKQLEVDNKQQNDQYCQAKQQYARLNCSLKDMAVEITELEEKCKELMMTKFGRRIDLDALQMQTGNRKLEELKQEKLLKEAEFDQELSELDAKVYEARDDLCEVTKRNTELLHTITSLNDEKSRMEHTLATRQTELCKPRHHTYSRRETQEDIQRLEETVKRQSRQQRALRKEINLLSLKGGHALPPTTAQLLPHIRKPASGHPSNPAEKQRSPSRKGPN